ncbi:Transcriptional regulator GlxA family, contains an amidase domain and an AraC-type DNA-binding HTH domain [Nonomuraea solani]|uniref:Transcriptional regulator GlxA family, contains an amidase domain and an AraC-type DNA-binding HTH domain n=1 Tax=Nonomuraea solani TaxID=1144553 RepID=A0A1H5VE07_9ACTN|nr:helix-turn-helix domain-containing protein [Nonomuraea solani]SEF85539.1 Transcriptional regulator GlxA family, contains an amidase domain and an AraC-type DNA-binding HTH domain [Nonomuraea solani]
MDERLTVVVGYPGSELLDISCATTPLYLANSLGGDPAYRIVLASPGGADFTCDSGLTLRGQDAIERITGPLDTLIVSGGAGHEEAADNRRLVGHIRRLSEVSRRVASLCTGASVLAAAGLLDGRRATTHWNYARLLAARHPEVTVDPAPIYIREGKVSTAAGVTSALDLTLAFIEEDHGTALARKVARGVVTYLQRPGNQAQVSMFVSGPPPGHPLVRRAVDHITLHLDGDLSAAALAARLNVSERHLTRLCLEHLGLTPGRYVRQARIEAAAQLLSSSSLPTSEVAVRCGFGSAESLRQAFVAHYGVSPSRYRRSGAN